MEKFFEKINIDENANGWLKEYLFKVVNSPTKNFIEVNNLTKPGLYLIFDDIELLYVGITTNNGRERLSKMLNGSHSFSKKLIEIHLRHNNIDIGRIKEGTISTLISNGKLTKLEYDKLKAEKIEEIKRLKFKFFEYNAIVALQRLEHFAIAVLNPLYNQ